MNPSILYIRGRETPAPWWQRPFKALQTPPFLGQDGFFRGGLYAAFRVVEAPLEYLARNRRAVDRTYDWVVVNFKAGRPKQGLSVEELQPVRALERCGKALFINYARADVLPGDRVLDPFDIVFKRELLRDIDRYPVSLRNRAKLRTTMLACPLVHGTRGNARRLQMAEFGFRDVPRGYAADAFFSGADTHDLRRAAVARLREADFRFRGGLQFKPGRDGLDDRVRAAALSRRAYIRAVRGARVNPVLDGIGQFTFRHLELWCLCAFMLSSPSLREVQLPLDVAEGRDYVCFDDVDDMIDKVRYYAGHDTERERMARSGRRRFEEGYSFVRHGAYIRACLGV
ncbi:MAG: glycosyltransferase family 1 protein [Lentisphaerae bacterium]|nr:glycosyltransferase family 1 protein [Lentisphaerota bacterium]